MGWSDSYAIGRWDLKEIWLKQINHMDVLRFLTIIDMGMNID